MSNYKGFPIRQAMNDQDLRWRSNSKRLASADGSCSEGGDQGCGLAVLQAVIDAAAYALQTLMQDAHGSLIR